MSAQQPGSESRRGRHSESLSRFLVAIYVPAVLLLVVVAVISAAKGIPVGTFTRDPVQVMGAPFYTGLISNAGILVWCAGAVMALFAGATAPRIPERREQKRFLIWSGALTLGVLLDDFFILHDQVFPDLFHVYEQVFYCLYLAAAALYVIRFRRQLFGADVVLLVLAAAFMGISVIMDQWHMLLTIFGRMIIPENYLLEDGAKLLSQVTWMGYLARRSADAVGADR